MSNKKVIVISPSALDNGQLERIRKVISKIIVEDVEIFNEIDEQMLGGLKVIIGTKEIDLTLKNIIRELEEKIDG
jgi:F0F1-type ATP synthase delta subunit